MKIDVLLGIISSAGLFHAAYMVLFLLSDKKTDRKANLLLSILLMAYIIRISKSAVFALFGFTPYYYPLLGLMAMSITGPTLLFYLKRLFRSWPDFRWHQTLHLLPLFLISLNFWEFPFNLMRISYLLIIIQTFLYFCYCLWLIQKKHPNKKLRQWLNILVGSGFGILLVYFIQFIGISDTGYVYTTLIAALILWSVSYLVTSLFENLKKIHHYHLNNKEEVNSEEILLRKRLRSILTDPEFFRDAEVNLTVLSKKLQTPPARLSYLIQMEYGKSFPEVINYQRISFAKDQLLASKREKPKIESIAYDSGFQSPSTFYAYFKKTYQMTPTQYKKKYS